jgi:hypothetical protein
VAGGDMVQVQECKNCENYSNVHCVPNRYVYREIHCVPNRYVYREIHCVPNRYVLCDKWQLKTVEPVTTVGVVDVEEYYSDIDDLFEVIREKINLLFSENESFKRENTDLKQQVGGLEKEVAFLRERQA